MDIIPKISQWTKKWGPLGAILVIFLIFIEFSAQTILGQVIEDYWNSSIKPFLVISVPVTVNLFVWQILLFIVIISSISLGIYFAVKFYRTKKHINTMMLAIKLPSEGESYNQGEIIKAIELARKRKLSIEKLVTIIEQAVNLEKLSPKVGTEIASEFGYILALETDDQWKAIKRRRNETE